MITNWDQLPLELTVREMADLSRLSVATIQRRCAKRTMRPAPIEWQAPYRWYREHVKAQLENRAVGIPVGRPSRRKPFARVRAIKQELATAIGGSR